MRVVGASVTVLGALLLACCGKSSADTPVQDAAPTDGFVDAKGGSGGTVADVGVSGSGGTGGGLSDAANDVWQPGGDPGWQAVPWATTCELFAAANPANAVPPLMWSECGTGCQRLVPNWPNKSGIPLYGAQLFVDGDTLKLSVHMRFADDWRKAVFDESFRPIAAWRSESTGGCGGNLLQWTKKHVCLVVGNGLDPTYQAFLSPNDLSGNPLAVYATQPFIPLSCNEDLFIGSSTGGIPYLRDLDSGLERWIQFPEAMPSFAIPSGPNAFFVLMGVEQGHEKLTGWVWRRPDDLEQLVDAGSEMVYDIRSDGNTLVWVQTASASSLDPATGTLWTSPFATSASEVHATQRRAVPALTIVPQYKVAGQGYYALVEQPVGSPERYLHIYRLSDARHWKVPTIADVRPADLVYIDAEEVWFLGTTLNNANSTIIRQKLDALGPGD